MEENFQARQTYEYLQYTNKNIFLTGKAGTGKTTFLKNLKNNINKNFIVVAPTGVAAMNADGVTIHSFFQLKPQDAFVPNQYIGGKEFSESKKNLIKNLELLVIDEISMVRCDLLDAIDYRLRQYRSFARNLPFGGVQLLMVGDLSQIPPVVKNESRTTLRKNYGEIYFFYQSLALRKSSYITITLDHIYRQTDKTFLRILNNIRENKVSVQDIEELNTCYREKILDNIPEDYVVLCTHNERTYAINRSKMDELETEELVYRAKATKCYKEEDNEDKLPAVKELVLKVGAKVVFLVNGYDINRNRFYNGKIGTVSQLEKDYVIVHCQEDEISQDIVVEPYTWEKTDYGLSKDGKKIEKNKVLGEFTQIPLRPAWALTIHKAQGLTFKKLIVDCNRAFAAGQVYVALSRCTTMQGLILTNKFDSKTIILDQNIANFNRKSLENAPNETDLNSAKETYYKEKFCSLFDFKDLSEIVSKIEKHAEADLYSLESQKLSELTNQILQYRKTVEKISKTLSDKLEKIFSDKEKSPEERKVSATELGLRAKDYFLQKLDSVVELIILCTNLVEQSEDEDWGILTNKLIVETERRLRFLHYLDKNEFEIKDYIEYSNRILSLEDEIEPQLVKQTIEEKIEENQENNSSALGLSWQKKEQEDDRLFVSLLQWRKTKAEQNRCNKASVLTRAALRQIAAQKPSSTKELSKIRGFRKEKRKLYGEEILEIVQQFQ